MGIKKGKPISWTEIMDLVTTHYPAYAPYYAAIPNAGSNKPLSQIGGFLAISPSVPTGMACLCPPNMAVFDDSFVLAGNTYNHQFNPSGIGGYRVPYPFIAPDLFVSFTSPILPGDIDVIDYLLIAKEAYLTSTGFSEIAALFPLYASFGTGPFGSDQWVGIYMMGMKNLSS